ncbi:MAG: energy transducer TonB [Bacteroidota bacterium]|nr:MAG: energy transducer TonB [Bacteroidota bacterium]
MQTAPAILFDPNGCISRVALSALIDKRLTQEQLLTLQKHASTCPLCADAIEGAGQFSSSKVYGQRLDKMHFAWRKSRLKPSRSRSLYYGVSTVAASLVIIFGIYFILRYDKLMNTTRQTSPPVVLAEVMLADTIGSAAVAENIRPASEKAPSPLVKAKSEKKEIVVATAADILMQEEEENSETFASNSNESEEIVLEDEEMVVVGFGTQNVSNSKTEECEAVKSMEQSQVPTSDMTPAAKKEKEPSRRSEQSEFKASDRAYYVAEVMPVFQGGNLDSFSQFLADSIRMIMPDTSLVRSIIVSFVVEADGSVNKVKLISGTSSDSLNKQIIEFVKSSPTWTPAYQGGKAVAMEQQTEVNIHKR